MSKYEGLYTFDVDNHRYIPVGQADGIIDCFKFKHESKEPLIKDTECREIMRLWADRCGVKTVILFGSEFRYGAKSICFGDDFGLEHLKVYSITELCGEEEE